MKLLSSRAQSRILGAAGLPLGLALAGTASGSEHQVVPGHVPSTIAHLGLKPVGAFQPTNQLTLIIGLPLRNPADLYSFLGAVHDPTSPHYRQYLSVAEFTERFGPSRADYQAVIDFATAQGLEVTGTPPNRMFVKVSGKVADIEKMLHVKMCVYQHPTEARTFFAPNAEPTLDLTTPVLFLGGLNNLTLPRPLSRKADPGQHGSGGSPLVGSGPSGSYLGKDFRAAYAPGVTLNGSGQVLGLLEGDGYFASDIAQYESQAGLSPVPLTNVLLDGFHGIAFPDIGNNSEVALDIEMAVSMAPGLEQIIVYEANLSGGGDGSGDSATLYYDLLNRMATDNLAKQLSSSWKVDDDPLKTQIYQEFALQGQSYFQASGDEGAYYPGSYHSGDNPYFTAVGGTTLSTSEAGGAWSSETVWNWWITGQKPYASGGGIVTNFALPTYQQGIDMTGNGGSTTLRNVPDVAMIADNIYVIADKGQVEFTAGTSCAAPLWAAFTALVNQQAVQMGSNTVGFLNPALYAIGKGTNYAADFHDITAGNNTTPSSTNQFYARAGYDLCTGWGTPRGAALINDLAPLDTLQIMPSSGFMAAGYAGGPFATASQQFTLTNSTVSSLNWSIGTTSAWISVSSTSGTLLPGGTATATIAATTAATGLRPGIYRDTVWFTNLSDGEVQNRQFALLIKDDLEIVASTNFTFTRLLVDSFPYTNVTFTLTNGGAASFDWSVGKTSTSFNVVPDSGTLSAASSLQARLSLTPAAMSLGAGTYTNTLWFTNRTDVLVQARPVVITVWPWIVNGGFETADFAGWTLSGNIDGFRVTSRTSKIHSGTYGAAFGSSGSLGYLSQNVPTTPGGLYLLSLWLHVLDGPNQFEVSWNGRTLYNATNLPAMPWTNLQFIVNSSAGSSVLQLGGRDDSTAVGVDDVSLVSVSPPELQGVAMSANSIALSWNTQASLGYQLQYASEIPSSGWANLGNLIRATNQTMTLFDAVVPGANARRFYRVLLVP